MSMSIRTRLKVAFGVVLTLLAIVGSLSVWNTLQLAKGARSLYEDQLKGGTVNLANVERELWKLRYGFAQFLVLGPADREKIVAEEPQHYKRIEEEMRLYASADRTPEQQKALAEFNEVFAKYVGARPKWFQLQKEGRLEEAAEWRAATTTPWGAASAQGLAKLIELQRDVATERFQQTEALARRSNRLILILTLIALAAGLFIAFSKTEEVHPIEERPLREGAPGQGDRP